MKKWTCFLIGFLSAFFVSSGVFAAGFDGTYIEAEGYGAIGQPAMAARRAAVIDAQRNLLEIIQGVQIDAETTVAMATVSSDTIRSRVSGVIRGAQIVSERQDPQLGYVVKMRVSAYGSPASLAGAVFSEPWQKENFASAEAYKKIESAPAAPIVAAAPIAVAPAPRSADTSPVAADPAISESSAQIKQIITAPPVQSAPAMPGIKSAIMPVSYTGLIVDCGDLKINTAMSPVIRDADHQPIYGHKNLDYQTVISKGMASYSSNGSNLSRAGSSPLRVKAIAVDGFSYPVVSQEDAARILAENAKSHFLDAAAVVIERA